MQELSTPLPIQVPIVQIDVSPKGVVETFLAGRTKQTLRAYKKCLEDFKSFLQAKSPEEAATMLFSQHQGTANAVLLSYKNHLIERQLTPATINQRLSAIRALGRLARLVGLVPYVLEVESMPVEVYRDTRGPGREGVAELLKEAAQRTDEKGKRDIALLRLMYDLALRRGEVERLNLADLDMKKRMLWIKGKGRSAQEWRSLPDNSYEALKAWVKVRGQEAGPLFTSFDPSQKGDGRLKANGIYEIVSRLGEQLDIKARPHGLRHAAITDALDATNGNVRDVMRFSRHKDLKTLTIYDDARKDAAGAISSLVSNRIKV
jgi:integrase/recombinase XerC